MFKTRKFQSWARVGATSLPPSLTGVSLFPSVCPFSLPPLFLPFLSLLFVFFLLQLRNSTNSAKLSAHHNARSVSLSLSLSHTGADIRLPEKLFRRTKRLPACQTYLFCHKLLHKQAQCNFNQFYGTFICQAPEPAPACLTCLPHHHLSTSLGAHLPLSLPAPLPHPLIPHSL